MCLKKNLKKIDLVCLKTYHTSRPLPCHLLLLKIESSFKISLWVAFNSGCPFLSQNIYPILIFFPTYSNNINFSLILSFCKFGTMYFFVGYVTNAKDLLKKASPRCSRLNGF